MKYPATSMKQSSEKSEAKDRSARPGRLARLTLDSLNLHIMEKGAAEALDAVTKEALRARSRRGQTKDPRVFGGAGAFYGSTGSDSSSFSRVSYGEDFFGS
jgi:hypothetical protein